MSTPPKLNRQCADPRSFFETHGREFEALDNWAFLTAPETSTLDETDAYNHFTRLAHSYTYFVQGTPTGVESQCKFVVSRILPSLQMHTVMHENERTRLLQRAGTLLARAVSPPVRLGASVADLFSTVYGYIAMRISCELSLSKRLALTVCPNHEEALFNVRTDMQDPTMTENLLKHAPYVDSNVLKELEFQNIPALFTFLNVWSDCVEFHNEVVAFVRSVEEERAKLREQST